MRDAFPRLHLRLLLLGGLALSISMLVSGVLTGCGTASPVDGLRGRDAQAGADDASTADAELAADAGAADTAATRLDSGVLPVDAGRDGDAGAVRRDGGAPDAAMAPSDAGETARHHPLGYSDPAMHGFDLETGSEDCRSCHGGDLTGGRGPSCDGCHADGWRTNCTYCHGGTDGTTGAPPRDLDGTTARDQLRFRAHTAHVTASSHPAYDCTQCHVKPTDVLSSGHVFDDTPGSAEVTFTGGLSAAGTFEGLGACANLYCHGSGQMGAVGAYDHRQPTPDCSACHAGPGASSTAQRTMSGEHRRHLGEGIPCNQCHAATLDANDAINNPSNHVNGVRDVMFSGTRLTRSASGSCNGLCHGKFHVLQRW